jgi:hypothetical protein
MQELTAEKFHNYAPDRTKGISIAVPLKDATISANGTSRMSAIWSLLDDMLPCLLITRMRRVFLSAVISTLRELPMQSSAARRSRSAVGPSSRRSRAQKPYS